MDFKSDLRLIENLEVIPEQKNFPQLFRADIEFAKAQGHEQFNVVLSQLERLFKDDGFKYTSIDTRTHMLMKGMYPCIPGWHCDDFYRPTGDQPDLINVEKMAPQKHYLIVLGDCSKTEFLCSHIGLPRPESFPKDKPAYFYYDEFLEKELTSRLENTKFVEPNKIYTFGPTAFHRGSPASKNDWRTFIRLTRSNHYEPKNELRYQSNVYLKDRVSW